MSRLDRQKVMTVFAWRHLIAARWNSFAVVITLALGTGANTAVLAVAYGMLLRPLPFTNPDQLVIIDPLGQKLGSHSGFGTPLSEVDHWRRRLPGIDGLAGFAEADLTVRQSGHPTSVRALLVTEDFFRLLSTQPASGTPVADDQSLTLVTSAVYATRTGSDVRPRASIDVDGLGFQVAAVMSPAFAFPDDSVEMWVPAKSIAEQPTFGEGPRTYRLLARLRPGVSKGQIQEAAQHVLHDLHPTLSTRITVTVDSLADVLQGNARTTIEAFLAASMLLLLVACANVAMLLVGRSAAHARESAIQIALGAGRAQVISSALLESLLLAGAGSLMGLAVAEALLRLFIHSASSGLPDVAAIRLDSPVLIGAVLVGVVVSFVSGLAPALVAARTDVAHAFRLAGSSTSTRTADRMRAVLVVLQVAGAVVLLAGAGLFARSIMSLLRNHMGVDPDHVLTARLALDQGDRPDAQGRREVVERLLERVRTLPGVVAAGVGSALPPRHNELQFLVTRYNEADRVIGSYLTNLIAVTPGYLEALGVPLEQGRLFDDRDERAATPLVILSHTAARDLSWVSHPLDAQFGVPLPTAAGKRVWPLTVGIVSSVPYAGLDTWEQQDIYLLWSNLPPNTGYLVARTTGDPQTLGSLLPQVIRGVDPELPIYDVRSLDDEMDLAVAGRMFRLWLATAFGVLCLTVALVGLSATVMRAVTERRRELAIRSALGATERNLVTLVGGQGLALTAVGLTVGLATAAAFGRWLESLLPGTSPYDPQTYSAIAVMIAVLAAGVCYLSTRRVARVDLIDLIRTE